MSCNRNFFIKSLDNCHSFYFVIILQSNKADKIIFGEGEGVGWALEKNK